MKSLQIPLGILVPNLAFAAYGLWQVAQNFMPDLFIYRAGADLGWHGESPYTAKIIDAVKLQYPDDDKLHANCGYFLPPQAIVLFGPFASVPWATAKLLYLIATLIALAFCWYGTLLAFRKTATGSLNDVPLILPGIICFHLVTLMTFNVGQTTILAAGAIIAGQLAWQADRRWLGAFLWSLVFVKPHIALPLLPLAYLFGGWRRLLMLIAWLAVLNLSGCLLAGGTPRFAFEYLDYLQNSHKLVEFNRVEFNPQIVSWNAALFSLGGPAINLSILETLAGMAVFSTVAVLRCSLSRTMPTPAWMAATAITGGLVCSQVLGYELFLLVLVVPHVLDCLERGFKFDAYAICFCLAMQMMPLNVMMMLKHDHYRCGYLLLLAGLLLVRVKARH